MRYKILFVMMALSLISTSANADYLCRTPQDIRKKVAGECMYNAHVAEAAVVCLKKLEAAIKLAGLGVAALAQNNANKTKEAQDGFQGNNAQNNNVSVAALNILIRQANIIQGEVITYLDETILAKPEDYDVPEVTGMDEKTYLKSTPCYAENKEVIANVLEDIDFHLSDLELARDQSLALEAGSSQNKGKLDGSSANPLLNSPTPTNNAQPSKKTKYKASDISGTEEEKNKK